MHKKATYAIIGIFKSFKYEVYLCNGCHDLMQKAMNFNDVPILPTKGPDYTIHFLVYDQR